MNKSKLRKGKKKGKTKESKNVRKRVNVEEERKMGEREEGVREVKKRTERH